MPSICCRYSNTYMLLVVIMTTSNVRELKSSAHAVSECFNKHNSAHASMHSTLLH